jgi:hypothetical protein
MNTNRIRINTLALGARLPTIQFRRAADFVDKILRGAKPADLPVEQPTRSTTGFVGMSLRIVTESIRLKRNLLAIEALGF